MNRKNSWTVEEKNLLKQVYNNPKSVILPQFKKSWQSIRLNMGLLGLTRDPNIIKQEMIAGGKAAINPDKWTSDEETILKNIYEHNSKIFITSQLINRTWKSIRERALKLKLSRDKEQIYKDTTISAKKTVLAKYGVEYTTQIESMKEKSCQTNLERRGFKFPSQSPLVRQKIKDKVQERYGVDNVFQSKEIKQKIVETNIEKYGASSPNQNETVRKKSIETNQKKFGVDNPFQLIDRVQKGMIGKYGEKVPLRVPEILERKNNTNIQRYGFKTPSQNIEVQNKTTNTNLGRYGFKAPSQNSIVKKKIIDTNIKKYGVPNPAQLEEIKEKIKKTCLDRFGYEYSLQSKEVREKGYLTAKRNKSFSKSKEEGVFLTYLKLFDIDITTHVKHPLIGHVIDYFMPNYDLWVQYDGVYWHGKIIRSIISRHTLKIKETIERDKYQNENIPNLIRFWSDDVKSALKKGIIIDFIADKLHEKHIMKKMDP